MLTNIILVNRISKFLSKASHSSQQRSWHLKLLRSPHRHFTCQSSCRVSNILDECSQTDLETRRDIRAVLNVSEVDVEVTRFTNRPQHSYAILVSDKDPRYLHCSSLLKHKNKIRLALETKRIKSFLFLFVSDSVIAR